MPQDCTSGLTQKEQSQFEKLLNETFEFVDNPCFHPAHKAVNELFGSDVKIPPAQTSWYIEHVAHNATHNSPIHKNALLNKEQEALLFLRFNFAKFQLTEYLKKIKKEGVSPSLVKIALQWHVIVIASRKQIIEMNLSLVLSLARKRHHCELDDAIGDGNLKLHDAVEGFDVAKGFKFSTYFWYAFVNSMVRKQLEDQRQEQLFPVSYDPEKEMMGEIDERPEKKEDIEAMQHILNTNTAKLTSREKFVIKRRWFDMHEDGFRYSLEEIGVEIQRSRTLIQIIERKALNKIKAAWLKLVV